ncbi:MAG TPA: FtsQ-type POTRA domain-containing protein [Candidatus Baltobacteraceae bacterium]|nr:FtsQ-type POTRA domain-containing protein [Candidatus Baltobacteraceae bacterium]
MLADEEPKYLRRQKPLEIRRRKFGRKAWQKYLRATMWAAVGLAGAWIAYDFGHFLLASPEMALIHPEQVALAGNHYVARASVLEIFAEDRGKSVLRIPLDRRRAEIESIAWVEHASVRRVLPNRIDVDVIERTPIAFLRDGSGMALVDVHGVILERPIEGNFHFPVVTGIGADMPQDDREQRMQLFSGFIQQIDATHPGASEQVSEVDLSDAHDVRATLSGLQPIGVNPGTSPDDTGGWGQADAPVVVHFGDSDFASKYQTLIEDIGQWRATTGRVESIDLRFGGEAVVNPDTAAQSKLVAQQHAAKPSKARAAKHLR